MVPRKRQKPKIKWIRDAKRGTPCRSLSARPLVCRVVATTNDTKNKKQRRANMDGLINEPSLWSRWRLENPLNKNKNTESNQRSTFCSVAASIRWTGRGTKKLARTVMPRVMNQLAKNQRNMKQSSKEGTPCWSFYAQCRVSRPCHHQPHQHKKESQSQCRWYDRRIICSVEMNRKKTETR